MISARGRGHCGRKLYAESIRFDKVTESLKVGTFLRHSVE